MLVIHLYFTKSSHRKRIINQNAYDLYQLEYFIFSVNFILIDSFEAINNY